MSFLHSMWYLSMSDDWLAPSRYSWATVSPKTMPDSPSQRLFRETVREPTISWRLERTDCRDLCRRVASWRSVISCQDFSMVKISDWVQTGNPLRKMGLRPQIVERGLKLRLFLNQCPMPSGTLFPDRSRRVCPNSGMPLSSASENTGPSWQTR